MSAGSTAAAAGPLSPAALMAEAVEQAGLDVGDDDVGHTVRVLVDAAGAARRLTPAGWQVLHRLLVRHLRNRLQARDYHRRHPEAGQRPLGRPVVITGLPRTGTTLLHNLLALHPAHRPVRLWEALQPAPADEDDVEADEATRVARAERWVDRLHTHTPDFAAIHPLTARGPEECDRLLLNRVASLHLVDLVDADGYAQWFFDQPQHAAYADHAHQLRVLDHHRPTERRWLLKSPGHLAHLEALRLALPGAVVIHCHRDPLEAVASYASLIATIRRPLHQQVAPARVGDQALARCAAMLDRACRARGELEADAVLDVAYPAVTADPLGQARRVCDWLGAPVDADTDAAMRAWLAAHPRDQHGAHRYDPADFGLDRRRVHAAFADYYDHFAEQLASR